MPLRLHSLPSLALLFAVAVGWIRFASAEQILRRGTRTVDLYGTWVWTHLTAFGTSDMAASLLVPGLLAGWLHARWLQGRAG
jgi:hypothetical protein